MLAGRYYLSPAPWIGSDGRRKKFPSLCQVQRAQDLFEEQGCMQSREASWRRHTGRHCIVGRRCGGRGVRVEDWLRLGPEGLSKEAAPDCLVGRIGEMRGSNSSHLGGPFCAIEANLLCM